MPKFSYTGFKEGASVRGEVNAPSEDAVIDQLVNQDIQPVEINEISTGGGAVELKMFIEWPSDDDIILFTRQMYTLIKSGVSMVRSFQGLTEGTHNQQLVKAMKQIIQDLQAGRDLSMAMGEHPKIFSNIYLRMVRMGEETGRIDEAFLQLYNYLEVDKTTRKQIKSALRYPTFVVIAITVAMFVVNYFVIPKFATMFSSFGSDLPLATQILLSVSKFTEENALLIIGVVFSVVYSFKHFIGTTGGRLWWDEKRLVMPIVGNIINRATLARFARAFSMGSESGLPVVQTLGAVAEAVDNAYMEKKINAMREGIERGESITQAAYRSEMFTPLVLQMFSVGEETGGIAEMMREVAEFYEREVEYDVANLSSAIEPLLLTVIGGMVLVLALGIFMPMWDLAGAAM